MKAFFFFLALIALSTSGFAQIRPRPIPLPTVNHIEVSPLVLDLFAHVPLESYRVEIFARASKVLNTTYLNALSAVCMTHTTTKVQVECLIDGMKSATKEIIGEKYARKAVVEGCSKTGSYMTSCYEGAFLNGRFPRLNQAANSCRKTVRELQPSCYRALFTAQL